MASEDDIEEMCEVSLDRLKSEAKALEIGDARGAMLVVAGDEDVTSYPFLGPNVDSRLMGLWMLAAMMGHVSNSAASDMPPIEAAQWAEHIASEYDPDKSLGEVIDGE